jgi:drug/metabolite transporter (DMT)-like permease
MTTAARAETGRRGEALKRIGATRAALLGALGPVSTILLAWAGMDEAMTGLQIVGAMLVLGGVGLLSLPRRSPALRTARR